MAVPSHAVSENEVSRVIDHDGQNRSLLTSCRGPDAVLNRMFFLNLPARHFPVEMAPDKVSIFLVWKLALAHENREGISQDPDGCCLDDCAGIGHAVLVPAAVASTPIPVLTLAILVFVVFVFVFVFAVFRACDIGVFTSFILPVGLLFLPHLAFPSTVG